MITVLGRAKPFRTSGGKAANLLLKEFVKHRMEPYSINIWPLQGQLQASNHSARSAGSKGERNAAHVATIDAVNPDINTASSNKPSEKLGSCAWREKNTGAMASRAQAVPVTNPQKSSSAFSATTISVKCEEL